METAQDLQDLAERTVALARQKGAHDAEVLVQRSSRTGFSLENEVIRPDLFSRRFRMGIRVLRDGWMGMAACAVPDMDTIGRCVERALAETRPTLLRDFAAPPGSEVHPGCADLFAMARDPSSLFSLARRMRMRLHEVADRELLASFRGFLGVTLVDRALATGQGAASTRRAKIEARANLNACWFDQYVSPSAPEDPTLLEDLARRAYERMPTRAIPPEEYALVGDVRAILHPWFVESLLRTLLPDKVTASALRGGLAPFAPGDLAVDPRITLVDDATDRSLTMATPFDDEGTPTRRTVLFEAGTFARFLASRAGAAAEGLEPTGHGYRKPILTEDPMEAPVREDLSGLVLEPGKRSVEEMRRSTDYGIVLYAVLGLHTADRARAAFTNGVLMGEVLREGEVMARCAPGTFSVAGQLFDGEGGRGLLADAEPSLEVVHTGSARLPYLLTTLRVQE